MKLTNVAAASAALLLPVLLPPAAAAPQDEALVVYSAGVDALLSDPKDRGLAEMLKLLDERIMDLPLELDEPNMPAPLLSMLVDALMKPMYLRVAPDLPAEDEMMMGPPVSIQLDFLMSDLAHADAMAGQVEQMFNAMVPVPSEPAPGHPSMQMMDMDGVPLFHGTNRVGRRPAFTMAINRVSDAAPHLGPSDLPPGVAPAFAARFDARPLQPLLEMFMGMAGPQAEMVRQQLEMAGVAGPDATEITLACGYGQDRGYGVLRYARYEALLKKMGGRAGPALTANALRLVPADATFAQVSSFDLGSYFEMMRSMWQDMGGMDEEMPDPFAMITMMTGVDLEHDIVDHLGTTFGMYMSDRTGGGGLLSTVGFAQVTDEGALQATLDRLTGMVDALGRQNARGYVRFARRDIGGKPVTVLTFPGLPVPLELCLGIDRGYLYSGLSVPALVAAMDQGRHGGESLVNNPRFVEMGGMDLDGAIQVSFIDTPRTLRDGYGLVSLGMTALANATRSPQDPRRGVVSAMPSYQELAAGARASVEVIRIREGDLLVHSQFDRSMLVNACGAIGAIGGSTGLIAAAAIGAGIAMPAAAKAREQAAGTKRMAQFRELGMAAMMYSMDHEDRSPPDLEALIEAGYLAPDPRWSGVESPDAGPEIWLNHTLTRMSRVQFPDRTILAYDRSALIGGEGPVSVLFCDGHVERMEAAELRRLMREAQHEGVEFADRPIW